METCDATKLIYCKEFFHVKDENVARTIHNALPDDTAIVCGFDRSHMLSVTEKQLVSDFIAGDKTENA